MTRPLTLPEITDFLDVTWGLDFSHITVTGSTVEIDLIGTSKEQVQRDIESYIAALDDNIDMATITITEDQMDDPRVDLVRIIMRTKHARNH
jgi:hypothetical protein